MTLKKRNLVRNGEDLVFSESEKSLQELKNPSGVKEKFVEDLQDRNALSSFSLRCFQNKCNLLIACNQLFVGNGHDLDISS